MKWPALIAAAAASLFAATTATWEMTGYQDFLRGRINGLSLTRDGRLMLGSKLDTVFDSGQPQIWSVAQAPDGSLYLGTGHRGRLYKLDAAGKSSLVWTVGPIGNFRRRGGCQGRGVRGHFAGRQSVSHRKW